MTEQPQHSTSLDSDDQQIGVLYGTALLDAAGSQVDSVVSELGSVVTECLNQHPNLERALASPRITQEQKEEMLDRILSGRVQPTLLNFLKVLCRRGRIQSLRAIQVTATQMREEQLGKQRIIVTSAKPLDDTQRDGISSAFQAAYGKEAILVEKIDESLLGGVMLRIGDELLDGSVLGKLDAIRSAVVGGVQKAIRDQYESLQST
jgi:F-type H+-transporting ATPase subunit delta